MIILQSILTSCPSYRVVLYSVILPDLSQASLILSRNCARPDNTILQAASEAVCLIVTTLTISSLGTVRPHPWEHGTGFLGLCSHSLRWWERLSSLTTTEQPYSSLSHLLEFKIFLGKRRGKFTHRISNRLSKFLRILGTGFSSAIDIALLSTGQVCCLLSHWMMQSAQKACSHLIMDRVRTFFN